MIETREINELASCIRQSGSVLIGIDGTDGAGKTRLANELAKMLDFHLVHLDDFLDKNRGGFLDYLDYSKIKYSLKSHRMCLVEGICLLDVMERIGFNLDFLIYIKRQQYGVWTDERELDIEGDLEEFIRAELQMLNSPALHSPDEPEHEILGIAEEIIRYHHRYMPQLKADLLYLWDSC